MLLTLQRKIFNTSPRRNTIGELFIDGKYFGITLEDEIRFRGNKVKHETAIQIGQYRVILRQSPRFKKVLPLIYNTDDFRIKCENDYWDGVLFHGGNDETDTSGCVLISKNYDPVNQRIWGSLSNEFVRKLTGVKNIGLDIQARVFSSGLNKQIE